MAFDVILIALFVAGFFVGFFRGVIRSLLGVGAWAVSFVFAIYLRAPLGDWLARSASFTPFYADLVAFAVIFFGMFGTLILVVMLSRSPTEWTRHPLLDDILGGVVGVFIVGLSVAAVMVMIDSYYAVESPPAAVDLGFAAQLRDALAGSPIASLIRTDISHFIGVVLGFILPPEIRAVIV